MSKLKIAVVATLDTKGDEARFLCDTIKNASAVPLLIDIGSYTPACTPDISLSQLLSAAGCTALEQLLEQGKSAVASAAKEALRAELSVLRSRGEIDGVIALGGAQGTAIATYAMQGLPIGFPKLMVSTIAGGATRFGDYVGTKDILMMPTIGDILGLNMLSLPILRSACGAILGMAAIMRECPEANTGKPVVALTMGGISTPCVIRVKELLEAKGFETVVFHCNGVGYKLIDELAAQGKLTAILDISPHEIGGLLYKGMIRCDENRFSSVYSSKLPVITVPGLLDIVLISPEDRLKPEYCERPYYNHTAFHTHARASYDELFRAGSYIGDKLRQSSCDYEIIVPGNGYSMFNKPGGLIYDSQANRGFVDGVRSSGFDMGRMKLEPYHINDPEFAEILCDELLKKLGGVGK